MFVRELYKTYVNDNLTSQCLWRKGLPTNLYIYIYIYILYNIVISYIWYTI